MTSPDCPLTKKSAKQDLQRLLELSTMSNSCTSSMRIASQTSALAARWLRVKALPVRDDVHHAFMTRPRHTSIKKDHEQPVVAGAVRNPTREMHFTLHYLMGDIPCYTLAAAN